MTTNKSYTDLPQSKKLAEILPLESADMVLPFRHTKNDEYIPGYVASRNYVEVYNEMMKLPGMEKEDVCQLIQPAWSLAALLGIITKQGLVELRFLKSTFDDKGNHLTDIWYCIFEDIDTIYTSLYVDNPVDGCYEMILKLNELNLL